MTVRAAHLARPVQGRCTDDRYEFRGDGENDCQKSQMKSPQIDAPLVDCHAHIFKRDMPFVSSAWNRPNYDFTAETYLETLDAHGIHFGVIAAISLFGTYNDYMLKMLSLHKRLRGTINVDPSISWNDLRALDDNGIVGIRLFLSPNTFGKVPDIQSDEYRRLFYRVRELGWHIHFLAADDIFSETLGILNDTGVNIIADHFVLCNTEAGLECPKMAATLRAMDKGNTWLKISAGFRFAAKPGPDVTPDYDAAADAETQLVGELISRTGCERLVWGSDAPFMGREDGVDFTRIVNNFAAAVPDPVHRRAISDTALKLYFQ